MHWTNGTVAFGWVGWLFMIIVILVFLGGLATVVVTTTRRPHTTAHSSHLTESPLDVLARRFAGGEIDEEEFRRRRDTLNESK